jgi:hypothetical protein
MQGGLERPSLPVRSLVKCFLFTAHYNEDATAALFEAVPLAWQPTARLQTAQPWHPRLQ